MPEITSYKNGQFCWNDLATTNPEAAKKFYGELLGMDCVDLPTDKGIPYTMLMKSGKAVAGLYIMPPEMQAQHMPPYWSSYVAVDDLDSMLVRAGEAGGKVVMPAMNADNAGRMAFVMDPAGAAVGLWQAGNHLGAQLAGESGTVCWNELGTRNTEAATAFYTHILGWTAETSNMDGMDYTIFKLGDDMAAGMYTMPEAMADIPPHWLCYFMVDDCDATVSKALELGGQVIAPAADIPGIGRFAVLQDAQGGVFAVIK